MRVRIRLFAGLREAIGQTETSLDLPPGATPEDVWRQLAAQRPLLGPRRASLSVAVNRQYAPFDRALVEGDEIVFIPPVSGG